MNGDWDLEMSTVCFSVQFRPFRGKISIEFSSASRVDVLPSLQLYIPYRYVNSQTKLYSVASARNRTVTTERPPLVGEVNASFCE
jgi:hypothetical protein